MRWDWAEGEANSSCGCSWSLSQPHRVLPRVAPSRGKGLCLVLFSSPALGCPQIRHLSIVKEAVKYEQLIDTAEDLFSDFAPHHTKFKTLRKNRQAHLVMCSEFDWSGPGSLIFCPSKTAQRGHTPPTKKKKKPFVCSYQNKAEWKPDSQDTATMYYRYQWTIQE